MTGQDPITHRQLKQYRRLIEDVAESALDSVLDEVRPAKDALQCILGNGGDFQKYLQPHIVAAIYKFFSAGHFVSGEVESNCRYPRGYVVKPIEEQIDILCKYFPELSPGRTKEFMDVVLQKPNLPDGAEALFAIPQWERIASNYNKAVDRVFGAMKSKRVFRSTRECRLGSQYLRQHKRTAQMFAKLSESQQGDILIIPAQFGLRYRGRSVYWARKFFTTNEFGFGSFAVSCMLLTHPERLRWFCEEDLDLCLWSDCPGDDCVVTAYSGEFDGATYFRYCIHHILFGFHPIDRAYGYSGSVSGFLLQ